MNKSLMRTNGFDQEKMKKKLQEMRFFRSKKKKRNKMLFLYEKQYAK